MWLFSYLAPSCFKMWHRHQKFAHAAAFLLNLSSNMLHDNTIFVYNKIFTSSCLYLYLYPKIFRFLTIAIWNTSSSNDCFTCTYSLILILIAMIDVLCLFQKKLLHIQLLNLKLNWVCFRGNDFIFAFFKTSDLLCLNYALSKEGRYFFPFYIFPFSPKDI